MAIEVQVREGVLSQALTEYVQAQLNAHCPPALPSLYLDRLDTVPDSVVFFDAEDSAVGFRLAIRAFVTSHADLMAHPNAAPPSTDVGVIQLLGSVVLVDTTLQVADLHSDTSGLLAPAPIATAVQVVVDTALAPLVGTVLFDTAPIVGALGEEIPAQPSLRRADGVVAIIFGVAGPLRCQLTPAQQWGVFLDQGAAISILTRRLPPGLPVNIRWQPNGATPAIVADIHIALAGLGIEVAALAGVLTATIGFIVPASIRFSVSWGLDLSGLASPLEPLARKLAREWVRANIPSVTHGWPTELLP
ncbi:MAG: hypothetical protein WDO12_01685 [Pseudomonadota bacterium]